ncbi:MAG: Sb-PDE family phosphodiesterase [Bacteroidales bacterium]|nr:Sb-PDE family phosphodiesterase [Bacteroidales bacterium]
MNIRLSLTIRNILLIFALTFSTEIQLIGQSVRKDFFLPDVPGYFTLKCDFHLHTMLSDGTVWPSDRVKEAWRDGLDAIAITDHVEYSPHKTDVTNDLNKSFDLAKAAADKYGIILIRGAEITRKMPPGHFNAFFLKEPNALRVDSVMDALKIAKAQGAFIIWNHPGWKSQQPDTIKWFPRHTEIYNLGLMQGIEYNNSTESYPVVFKWALEKNLTLFSNSDTHAPIDFEYTMGKADKRPMTIVFAKEKTSEGIHEALLDHRTVVYFRDTLAGDVKNMEPLVRQMIKVTSGKLVSSEKKTATVQISNTSDFPLSLCLVNSAQKVIPKVLLLEAHSTLALNLTDISFPDSKGGTITLHFQINNVLINVDTPLRYSVNVNFE